MKETFKFVVLGDTHYCWEEHHTATWQRNGRLDQVPDYVRYVGMRESVGSRLLDKVTVLQPDFLVSTGDFVEGDLEEYPKNAADELLKGWDMLCRPGVPVLIAKGTHEGACGTVGGTIYREKILPLMEARCGQSIKKEYYHFEFQGCVFLILDYLQFEPGGEQENWLIDELKNAMHTAKRIYLFAHPPLFLWGRHFFDTPVFASRIESLCRRYPVDAYFCGHTHNQSVSFHQVGNDGKGFLQLTASSVGYPDMPAIALDSYHMTAEYGGANRYLWGILEDSSPGFFLVEIDGNNTRINWHSLFDTTTLMLGGRRTMPICPEKPSAMPTCRCLSSHDLHQIKGAWINIFSVIRGCNDSEVRFNGILLGPIPDNVSYASRRFITLPTEALSLVKMNNSIEIKMPSIPSFAVGSVSLELLLYDGRVLHSNVAPENMVCGAGWKQYRQPDRFLEVVPGSSLIVSTDFEKGNVQ